MRLLAVTMVLWSFLAGAQPYQVAAIGPTSVGFGSGDAFVLGAAGGVTFLSVQPADEWDSVETVSGGGVPVLSNIGLAPSGPGAALGGKLCFTVNGGRALSQGGIACTDGTIAGTTLLAANRSSAPAALGSLLLYPASNLADAQLWKATSAPGSEALVKDINPLGSDNVYGVTAAAGLGWLSANDGVNGDELWKTDGTAAGTTLVKDIFPGSGSSRPMGFTAFGTKVLFRADNGVNGIEPWISDGTAAGTVLLADIVTGSGGSSPGGFVVTGSTAFFLAFQIPRTRLWRTDGTPAGTAAVAPTIGVAGDLAVVGSRVVFGGFPDSSPGAWQLYVSDGTTAGTQVVMPSGPTNPQPFASIGNKAFFSATGTSGVEVWVTDGTAAGTLRLLANGSPSFLQGVAFGPVAFFVLSDATGGATTVWQSDGTVSGTTVIETVPTRERGSVPRGLVGVADRVYCAANDGVHGRELWTSDGDAGGTTLVVDANPGSGNGLDGVGPYGVALGSTLLYTASTDGVNYTPWATSAGSTGAGSISPAFFSRVGNRPVVTNGVAFFPAYSSGFGEELWRSDGTPQGTWLAADAAPGAASSGPRSLAASADAVYFTSSAAPYNQALFRTTAVDGGFELVCPLLSRYPTPTSNAVFFSALTADAGVELWRTDSLTTALVADIAPGAASGDPLELTAVGSRVFFTADDQVHGRELWISDGTAAGTMLVKDINPGTVGAPTPRSLFAANGKLFFWANDGVTGSEPWVSDGTAAGTTQLKDVFPGFGSSGPVDNANVSFVAVGNSVYFAASDGVSGFELWKSDGTPGGTSRVADVFPGPRASRPDGFAAAGCHLFFTATGPSQLRELWALPLSDSTPPVVGATLTGTRGDGGWFRSAVTVDFTVTEPESVASFVCPRRVLTRDTAGTFLGCLASSCGGTTDGGVLVRIDTTPPTVTCPAGTLVVEADRPDGGPFDDAGVTASDQLSPTVALSFSPPLGVLPLGLTTLTATAADEAGNSASCPLIVQVRDSTAPRVVCAATLALAATSDAGALIPDGGLGVVVSDAVDPAPTVTATIPEGGIAPLGTHNVIVTATDHSGNTKDCAVAVTVAVTPPTLACPETLPLTAQGGVGAALPADVGVSVTDPVDPAPRLSLSVEPGTVLPVGTKPLIVTATNFLGASKDCTIAVVVSARAEPAVSRYRFGCAGVPAGAAPWALLVLLGRAVARRRSRG